MHSDGMAGQGRYRKLVADLTALLEPGFPGIAVEVEHSDRWDRMCVTFRWPGFADLLAEERFHRLVAAIPEKFRQDSLAEFVWLELTPEETVDAYLKLPRSEDIGKQEAAIYAMLVDAGFFGLLAETLGSAPKAKCPGDFSLSASILSGKARSPAQIRNAKLAFIRHGAYCDCQALLTAQNALATQHAGAA